MYDINIGTLLTMVDKQSTYRLLSTYFSDKCIPAVLREDWKVTISDMQPVFRAQSESMPAYLTDLKLWRVWKIEKEICP